MNRVRTLIAIDASGRELLRNNFAEPLGPKAYSSAVSGRTVWAISKVTATRKPCSPTIPPRKAEPGQSSKYWSPVSAML